MRSCTLDRSRKIAFIVALILDCSTSGAAQVAVRLTPDGSVGGASRDQIVRVLGVAEIGDKSLAALTYEAGHVVLTRYTADDRMEWRQQFPEHDEPSELAVAGDTIAILMGFGMNPRLVLMDANSRRTIASIDIPLSRGQAASLVASQNGPLWILVETSHVPDGAYLSPLSHRSFALQRVDAGKLLPPALSWTDSVPRAVFSHPSGHSRMSSALPWSPKLSVTASAEHVFISRGSEYQIDVYSTGGTGLHPIRGSAPRVALSAELADQWFAEWRKGLGAIVRESEVPLVRSVGVPNFRPALGKIFASRRGGLAVVRADLDPNPLRSDDATPVDLIGPDGQVIGQVTLPPGESCVAYTGTYMWVAVVDTTRRVANSGERPGSDLPLTKLVRYRIEGAR